MSMGGIDVGRVGIWTWILDSVQLLADGADTTVDGWRTLAPHLLD